MRAFGSKGCTHRTQATGGANGWCRPHLPPSATRTALRPSPSARTPGRQSVEQSRWSISVRSAAVEAPSTSQPASTTAAVSQADESTLALRSRLQLHNTMSRRKETFTARPQHPDYIQMYVCGVTVYDYSHIGHARVYVAFDILYRLLTQGLKYTVQYVRNFTDVDDKIIARANERGEDPLGLAGRYIDEFHKDMASLNCLSPTLEPRATAHIGDMIQAIQSIIANGHAYTVEGGDVYFEVETLPGYGALSGRQQEDNRAGERVAVDSRKRGPSDFALWKAAKPGEPSWDSPWGPGRPGWHIECSAMIQNVMGNTIDIHGGGRDLVFPHHENELAQARAMAGSPAPCCGVPHTHTHTHATSTSQPHTDSHTESQTETSTSGSSSQSDIQPEGQFVRYWLHNGFVNVDSEKMSKSLGNFFTIRDVLQSFHPLAMRWFLASTHYRAPVNYSTRALEEASGRLYYVYMTLGDAISALDAAGEPGQRERIAAATSLSQGSLPLQSSVMSHLLDDLNTPGALSELSAPLKGINDLLTTKAGKKQPDRLKLLAQHAASVEYTLGLLGLLPTQSGSQGPSHTELTPAALTRVLDELKSLALTRAGLTEADVQAKIQARADARKAKDFAASDAIRVELANKGIAIMDTPTGTTWRPTLTQ